MESIKKEVPVIFTVLRAVGIILSLLGVGVGVLYVLHGEQVYSIVLALVLIAPFVILSERLKNLKIKERKSPYYQPEYVAGGVYAVFFIIALFFFAHFWNIELAKKDELKREAENRIEEIKKLRDAYVLFVKSEIKIYENSVETNKGNLFLARNAADISKYKQVLDNLLGKDVVDYSKYMVYQNDTVINNKIIGEITKAKESEVKKKYTGYDTLAIDDAFIPFYTNAKSVFKSWRMFELSKTFSDIDIVYAKLLNEAKRKSLNEFTYKELEKSDFSIDNPFDISSNFFIALLFFALLNWGILSVYHKIDRYDYPFKGRQKVYKKR